MEVGSSNYVINSIENEGTLSQFNSKTTSTNLRSVTEPTRTTPVQKTSLYKDHSGPAIHTIHQQNHKTLFPNLRCILQITTSHKQITNTHKHTPIILSAFSHTCPLFFFLIRFTQTNSHTHSHFIIFLSQNTFSVFLFMRVIVRSKPQTN
jgi:hypothetical protein